MNSRHNSNVILHICSAKVQFENGDIDIAELDKAFVNDNTNYVGHFKNAPDVRVFASIPNHELGFHLIHVSLRFKGKYKFVFKDVKRFEFSIIKVFFI